MKEIRQRQSYKLEGINRRRGKKREKKEKKKRKRKRKKKAKGIRGPDPRWTSTSDSTSRIFIANQNNANPSDAHPFFFLEPFLNRLETDGLCVCVCGWTTWEILA